MVSDGLGWSRMVSDGLGWSRMVSDRAPYGAKKTLSNLINFTNLKTGIQIGIRVNNLIDEICQGFVKMSTSLGSVLPIKAVLSP